MFNVNVESAFGDVARSDGAAFMPHWMTQSHLEILIAMAFERFFVATASPNFLWKHAQGCGSSLS